MATEPQVVEHFFGVYLLYCKNPKYKGRTYIGYTVDPRRRINQHNAGQKFGGAWRTSNRGPWEMVLIIHGFPNSTSALRFEWAWQHPQLSRRLKHVGKKRPRQKTFEYLLEVCSAMLNCGPWYKLPLTVRWLDDDFGQKYSSHLSPPLHMPITYGKVTSKKKKPTSNNKPKEGKQGVKNKEGGGGGGGEEAAEEEKEEKIEICSLCSVPVVPDHRVGCIKPDCDLVSHLVCLAKLFCKDSDEILPVEGCCPICATDVLWGDLIRKKIGCNLHIDADVDESSSSSSSSSSGEEDDDYQSDD